MNPAYSSNDNMLQGGWTVGFSGQPVGPAVVQYTRLDMPAEPPKDHIIWSLFNMLYCGNPFCLGFAAFIFSIKGRMPDGFPKQPVGPAVVQYTRLDMPAEPPKDHIIWSLFNMLYYGNPFCLGFAAFIFSIKARDRKAVGDHNGARHYGSTARRLNIVATVLTSITILIAIIVLIVVSVQARNYVHSYNNYGHNSYGK